MGRDGLRSRGLHAASIKVREEEKRKRAYLDEDVRKREQHKAAALAREEERRRMAAKEAEATWNSPKRRQFRLLTLLAALRLWGPKVEKGLIAHLEQASSRSGGCWIWEGPVTGKGYARARIKDLPTELKEAWRLMTSLGMPGGIIYPRLLALELRAPVVKPLLTRHLCHKKRCVNPAHMAPGTAWDNHADAALGADRRGHPRGLMTLLDRWEQTPRDFPLEVQGALRAIHEQRERGTLRGQEPPRELTQAEIDSWTWER